MRLIDAVELKGQMMEAIKAGYTAEDMLDVVNEAPMIDAEPVMHGRWVYGREMMYCSGCSATYDKGYKPDYNYCPHCGAKMDDEVER